MHEGLCLSARKKVFDYLRLLSLGSASSWLLAGVSFLQASSLPTKSTEIVQLGAAHAAATGNVDLVDYARVHREDTFYALSETDLADGEAGLRTRRLLDNDALKRLQTLLIAFLDLDLNAD